MEIVLIGIIGVLTYYFLFIKKNLQKQGFDGFFDLLEESARSASGEKSKFDNISSLENDSEVVKFKKFKKEYMESAKWKLKRQQRLALDNYKCVVCGSNKKLDIHHITYAHTGNENLTDLITVCREHHSQIHDKYGYSYDMECPVIYNEPTVDQMTDEELDQYFKVFR